MYIGKLLASKIFFKKNFRQEYPPPLRQNTRLVRQNLTWLGNKTLAKLAGWEIKISTSLAENTENVCWIWLDRYTFSPGNGSVIFFFRYSRANLACVQTPPPNLPSVKIGEGAPCTIFTEETGEKGSVHRLVKITLRESYGINGYALV